MLRRIIIWGILLGGCVYAPNSSDATPLGWQSGLQEIQAEAQSIQNSVLFDVMSRHESPAEHIATQVVVPITASHVKTTAITQVPIPILALPESGTLILLGIGLAGIASLIRRKKDSS